LPHHAGFAGSLHTEQAWSETVGPKGEPSTDPQKLFPDLVEARHIFHNTGPPQAIVVPGPQGTALYRKMFLVPSSRRRRNHVGLQRLRPARGESRNGANDTLERHLYPDDGENKARESRNDFHAIGTDIA
jgi:hypothetical protein